MVDLDWVKGDLERPILNTVAIAQVAFSREFFLQLSQIGSRVAN
jgi:hypothetical protein